MILASYNRTSDIIIAGAVEDNIGESTTNIVFKVKTRTMSA